MTMTPAALFTSSLFLSSVAVDATGAETRPADRPAAAATTETFADQAWKAGEVLRIEGSGAHIRVRAHRSSRVRVRGKLNRSLDRVSVRRTQEGLTIRLVPLARGQTVYGRVDIEVPASANIAVLSTSGAVDVAGIQGTLDVNTLDGAVRAWDLQGRTVAVRTVTGSVDVAAGALETLEVDTVSGSILYTGRLVPGARCALSSLTGEIEVVDEPRLAGVGVIDSRLGRIAAR